MEVKNTTKCDCGYQFIIQDIQELKRFNEPKFYGGAVKHCSEAICPKCGKKVMLFLKQKGQTYVVIDSADIDTPKQKVETVIENNTSEIAQNDTNKTEENTSNEFICPECGQVAKSKAGLSSHMKKHNK